MTAEENNALQDFFNSLDLVGEVSSKDFIYSTDYGFLFFSFIPKIYDILGLYLLNFYDISQFVIYL
jgi:hypothetical protein